MELAEASLGILLGCLYACDSTLLADAPPAFAAVLPLCPLCTLQRHVLVTTFVQALLTSLPNGSTPLSQLIGCNTSN